LNGFTPSLYVLENKKVRLVGWWALTIGASDNIFLLGGYFFIGCIGIGWRFCDLCIDSASFPADKNGCWNGPPICKGIA